MAEADYTTLNRTDLNAYATEHGIADPESYATKVELIAAIQAAESETAPVETPPAEQTPPE